MYSVKLSSLNMQKMANYNSRRLSNPAEVQPALFLS